MRPDERAGLNTVTTAYASLGGPMTGLTFTSNETFRFDNPKVFAAVIKAFDGSFAWINSDKLRAARRYIEMTKEKKLTDDDLTATFGADLEFTKAPIRMGKMIDFLYCIGSVKYKPDWSYPVFQEAHALPELKRRTRHQSKKRHGRRNRLSASHQSL